VAADGASYYARASLDPDWLDRRNATARRWYGKLRETDPERFRKLREEKTQRDRERRAKLTEEERAAVRAADAERKRRERARAKDLLAHSLSFEELRDRCLIDGYPDAEETLRRVLRDEIRRGSVDYHSTSRRYSLNGGLPEEVKRALLAL